MRIKQQQQKKEAAAAPADRKQTANAGRNAKLKQKLNESDTNRNKKVKCTVSFYMGLTDQDWIGSAVSLTCDEVLGVFQGQIKKISADEITIVRAFRNGVPLRKQNAEVVLRCSDIKSINLIEPILDVETTTTTSVINKPTPVKLPHFSNILGKQQQLQQQQQQLLQQQQKQQAQHEREQELPATPRIKQANGHGNGSRNEGYAAASGVNSALSDKMHQLMLHANGNGSNGMRR